MTVPFQPLSGHAGLVGKGAHYALHRTGKRRSRVGNAEAHGVAQTDLHGHGRLAGKFHELGGEGQTEAVYVRAGDILKMAARHDAPLKGSFHDAQIVVHGLLTGLP